MYFFWGGGHTAQIKSEAEVWRSRAENVLRQSVNIPQKSKWSKVTTMLRWSRCEMQPAVGGNYYVRLNGFDRFPLALRLSIQRFQRVRRYTCMKAGALAQAPRTINRDADTPGSLSSVQEKNAYYYSKYGISESKPHDSIHLDECRKFKRCHHSNNVHTIIKWGRQ